MIPEPYELALLALAAARMWKLIGDDRILDRPRDWLLDHVVGRRGEHSGVYWSDFLVCPWCAGAQCSLLVYVAWIAIGPGRWVADDLLMAGVSLAAISALVGLFGVVIDALQSAAK